MMHLPIGLYDQLITEGLSAQIDPNHAEIQSLTAGAADLLADTITRQLVSILEEMPGEESDKAQRQLELVNTLLVQIRQRLLSESCGDKDRKSVV